MFPNSYGSRDYRRLRTASGGQVVRWSGDPVVTCQSPKSVIWQIDYKSVTSKAFYFRFSLNDCQISWLSLALMLFSLIFKIWTPIVSSKVLKSAKFGVTNWYILLNNSKTAENWDMSPYMFFVVSYTGKPKTETSSPNNYLSRRSNKFKVDQYSSKN